MLNVLISIDTEVWPNSQDWRSTSLSHEIDHDIYGITDEGDYGIRYQVALMNKLGLKGVFLVESLFASVVGLEPLREIVQFIRSNGQEVQLHVHSEWLEKIEPNFLPGRSGQNLSSFTEAEQSLLVSKGIENLISCGAEKPIAFRAGNYGASLDTLSALASNGILFDTSYNTCYLKSSCKIDTPDLLVQPVRLRGVYEIPISFYRDWPGTYRHAQVCACTFGEMKNALNQAWKAGWYSFVIVSHSFEMIRRPGRATEMASANHVVIRRFEKLCQFLHDNSDKFRTVFFSDLVSTSIPTDNLLSKTTRTIASSPLRTLHRYLEQALVRCT
jgi:hypothetical protein